MADAAASGAPWRRIRAMTVQGVLVSLAGVGVAIAVAVPLHRAVRRGSLRFNTAAAIAVFGVLAIAAAIAILS